jgi:Tfp pilus assembly protein PilV
MTLPIWMVSMFILGVVVLGLCFLFLRACEKI